MTNVLFKLRSASGLLYNINLITFVSNQTNTYTLYIGGEGKRNYLHTLNQIFINQ